MAVPASAQTVERFRDGFECWNGGQIDLMQDMYAEDGEFDVSAVFTDTPPFKGHGSMRQWDAMWTAWEGIRLDPIEVFNAGSGRFVVDIRLWGKGRQSGVEVDQRFGLLYTLRDSDDKIVRCQLFPSLAAAMAAAAAS
jgi:ketosteroid isomerase-like protein